MTDGDSMDNGPLATQKNLNFGPDGNGGTEAVEYEACNCPTAKPPRSPLTGHLMEQIIERDNLNRAYLRVVANKGAAGVDGMTVDDLLLWCRENGNQLKESLVNGTYAPSAVRGVKIPKPGGGQRQLGIPTVPWTGWSSRRFYR